MRSEKPGACSPSRNVVSNIVSLSADMGPPGSLVPAGTSPSPIYIYLDYIRYAYATPRFGSLFGGRDGSQLFGGRTASSSHPAGHQPGGAQDRGRARGTTFRPIVSRW